MELKSCYLETSSQTGPEASHKRTNVDMDLKQCYLEANSQAAPEAFLPFSTFSLAKASLATVVLARLASTSSAGGGGGAAELVVVLSWWWC